MSAGFGIVPYGTSVYGFSSATAVSVLQADAVTTHDVVVFLSAAPQTISPTTPGDAQNPASWTVQRLDTGAFLTPIQVTKLEGTEFQITTIEPFGPFSVQHQVTAVGVLDPFGNPVGPPNFAVYNGVIADNLTSQQAALAAQKIIPTDIANIPVPTSAGGQGGAGLLGGTFSINSSGDYFNQSGNDLLRKLVFRRLTTRPGDFFHLPDYGIDVSEKDLISSSDVVKLKASVENQILREPEVDQVLATITLTANGVLTIAVLVTPKIGQTFSVQASLPTAGVLL